VVPDEIGFASILDRDPTLENYGRSVILFGQNVASYKSYKWSQQGQSSTSVFSDRKRTPLFVSPVACLLCEPKYR